MLRFNQKVKHSPYYFPSCPLEGENERNSEREKKDLLWTLQIDCLILNYPGIEEALMVKTQYFHYKSMRDTYDRMHDTQKLPNIFSLKLSTNLLAIDSKSIWFPSVLILELNNAHENNAKATGLLVHHITWCNKLGTDLWVPFISSREAPWTTRIHLEWQRFGSVSPSRDL